MKTRIIYTKTHFEDDWFSSLTLAQRYLFVYLFTNTHIGLTGIYKLSKRVALLETGATAEEWDMTCQLFEDAGKIKFFRGWVYVVNSAKYSNYTGEKNKEAAKKEIALIPRTILLEFNYSEIPYRYPIDTPINHKPETINKKSYTRNQNDEEITENDWEKIEKTAARKN